MSNSLSSLLGKFGFCRHREALFIGSVLDARVNGGSFYVYSCSNCGKVFRSNVALTESYEVKSYCFSGSGELTFVVNTPYGEQLFGLLRFYHELKNGKLNFGREQLNSLLSSCERILSFNNEENKKLHKALFHASEEITSLEDLLAREKKNIEFLESVVDNSSNVIYNEQELDIIKANEGMINNSILLSKWLQELLFCGEVVIPKGAYKIFHLMLSVFYGYEKMRYKWEWKYFDSGKETYIFFNRKTRRTR